MTLFLIGIFLLSAIAQENNPVVMITDDEGLLKSGCWATLYDEKLYQGSSMTIFNGYDLEDLEFSVGPLWREKVKSIVAGPTGKLELFSEEDYQGKKYIIPAASHMKELPWDDFQSFKLNCVPLPLKEEQ